MTCQPPTTRKNSTACFCHEVTNQFDNNGNFNFTNAAGTNAQSFYLLQLQ